MQELETKWPGVNGNTITPYGSDKGVNESPFEIGCYQVEGG